MKLFALRDRIDDSEKDYGRHHALDLYTVIGTLSPLEWEQCLQFRDRFANESVMIECKRIVRELFASPDALGSIRLRESAYYRPEFQVEDFLAALHEFVGGSHAESSPPHSS